MRNIEEECGLVLVDIQEEEVRLIGQERNMELHLLLAKCCRGECKSIKNFKWKYKEE